MLYAAFKTLLLPPCNAILLGLAGLWIARRRPRTGRRLAAAALLLLYAMATPLAGDIALAALQPVHVDPGAMPPAEAIVVLGGGVDQGAPEWGGDTAKWSTLARVRYGAHLARRTGLPLLVTGGSVSGRTTPEAHFMRDLLRDEFGVPVRWVEDRSRDTLGNAVETARLLRGTGVRRVLLVTHAWHVPRARLAFEYAGLDVVPAATGYSRPDPADLLAWLPSAEGLLRTTLAAHEALGYLWYMLRIHT